MRDNTEVVNTPWKIFLELKMYFFGIFLIIYLKLVKRVEISPPFKFYGAPKVFKHRKSRIVIGKRFENRNWWDSNPLGVNHPTILCTWNKGAEIKIGDDVGISGGSIVASKSIKIGDGTLIGANCTIIDTDFHPVRSKSRRYDKEDIRSAPIKIGRNVFIGMNSIILKGVVISDNKIVPAGSVVRKNI